MKRVEFCPRPWPVAPRRWGWLEWVVWLLIGALTVAPPAFCALASFGMVGPPVFCALASCGLVRPEIPPVDPGTGVLALACAIGVVCPWLSVARMHR